ncbi:SAV_2336 N-terminal domain-related protein [Streptomyces xiamenensis]|uniref:SAV_2336 N-terminal domain-related protein n=1 Tax=Streptomyces xiamenensis TaxID=408015 RepID=UPI003D73DF87
MGNKRGGRRRDQLAELIGSLRRAGLEPGSRELAEALWLATHLQSGPAPADRGPQEATDGAPREAAARWDRGTTAAGRHDPGGGDPPPEAGNRAERRAYRDDEPVPLYPDHAQASTHRPGPGDALRVGVPEARALPSLLELERALRPLQRCRPAARPAPGPAHLTLDERRTAEDTARAGGLLLPAFRATGRRDMELQLLMDATSAMRVWQRLLGELTDVFGRVGAFRDIQVHYLHALPDGSVGVSGHFDTDPAGPDAVLHPERRLLDPTGRRLTVVVSDCVGPLWRDGAAHRLLHRITRHAPAAVVQPLPARLWARTRLPASHGLLTRAEGPASGARLGFTPDDPGRRPPSGAVPVPVLPPTAAALGAWARLLSGGGSAAVPAAVGWVRPDQPAAPPAHPGVRSRPAGELIARFRATASPGATRLAVHLAAAPLFLPVMQLIQRTMLPGTGPAELSEVLLSGLLRRAGTGAGADGLWYEFADGVQEELLQALGQDEAMLVLKHCSAYVEARFGKGGPNFPALALAQLSGGRLTPVPVADGDPETEGEPGEDGQGRSPQPFAEVAAKVLSRFLPGTPHGGPRPDPPKAVTDALRRSRELTRRFEDDGALQHLLDAVWQLERATDEQWLSGRSTDPELYGELAAQLLRLWRQQGEAGLLERARRAARTAASHLDSLPARTILARVLHASAAERKEAGDEGAALELWRGADREFAAVCATPGLPPDEALGIALERVRVLEEQWRLGRDPALLQECVGMLEAIADAWPAGRAEPSGLSLAHGRVLLRLAEAADREKNTEGAAVYAEQAARSLERAGAAQRAESAPVPARVRTTLRLVDALLLTATRWQEAGRHITLAQQLTDDRRQRAEALMRAGRLSVRRFHARDLSANDSGAGHLEEAALRFAEASRAVPRDRPDYSDLIAEWGQVLLERAQLPEGGPFTGQAIRVLRDCRMETPAGDPRLPERLLMLGRALMVRYRATVDLVDLREAEHLFSLAAHGADDALTRAWGWYELGGAHQHIFGHSGSPERPEQAAEAYRRAATEALRVADGSTSERAAVPIRLAATAQHQRGTVYRAAGRPRAAQDAFRAALAQWRRLPKGEDGERSAQALAELTFPWG